MLRRLSGVFRRRGKRTLSLPLFPEDGPCERDDEVEYDGDEFGYDTEYDSVAAGYEHYLYRRRWRRPVLRLCIPGRRGQQVSINFSSDGNDTGAQGFEARFRVRRGNYDFYDTFFCYSF